MSILIYLKDINPITKTKNRRLLKKHTESGRDSIYKDINHRICLYVCHQNFWMKYDLGYSLIRKIRGNNDIAEVYEIVSLHDGKSTKIYYNMLDSKWFISDEEPFPYPILASRCRKSIFYLEAMLVYIRFHYLKEFIEADILTYFKTEFIKYVNLDLLSNVYIKKYR